MMNLIDGKADEKRKFGPGHFDLIVIDEAHCSVYQRHPAPLGLHRRLMDGREFCGEEGKIRHRRQGLSQDAEIAGRLARRALGYDVSGKLTTSRTRPCRAFAPNAWRE